VNIQGKIPGQFDSKKLEEAVKELVRKRKLPEDTLLKSTGDGACRVCVNTQLGGGEVLLYQADKG
jgi:hypothetical protein